MARRVAGKEGSGVEVETFVATHAFCLRQLPVDRIDIYFHYDHISSSYIEIIVKYVYNGTERNHLRITS